MGVCLSRSKIKALEENNSDTVSRKWIAVLSETEAKSNYGQEGILGSTSSQSHLELRMLLEYPLARQFFCESATALSTDITRSILAWIEIYEYNNMEAINGRLDHRNAQATPIYVQHIVGNMLISSDVREQLTKMWKFQRNWNSLVYSSVFGDVFIELFHICHDQIFLPVRETAAYQELLGKLRRTYNITKASDFEYRRILGKGGFGLACEVWKKSTDTTYVMKIQNKRLLAETFGDEPWRACLELHAFATCNHPFIVSLEFAFQTKTLLVLVMDYRNGRDLGKLLKHGGPFSSEHVMFYAAEIASALIYLHKKRFVYRDLKPSNVLLNADGHVQLIDFGAVGDLDGKILAKCINETSLSQFLPPANEDDVDEARSKSSSADDSAMTDTPFDPDYNIDQPQRARSVVGTYGYMAPEIIELIMSQGHVLSMPAAGYSKAVDWWSLGVVVYKLLVGRYPFPISKDSAKHRQEVPSLEVICGPVDYSTLEKDKPAVRFITDLLQVTEINRLGYGDKGHYHVMKHPYFSFIDWTRLEQKLLSPPPVRTFNILGSTNRYHNLVDMLVQNGKESWLTPNATDSADLTQFDDNSAFFSWHYASRDAVALELRSQKRSKSLSLTGHQTPDASMKSSAHFDSSRSRSSRSVTASYSQTI